MLCALTGCGMLPGMQNLDQKKLQRVETRSFHADSTLIPITPMTIMRNDQSKHEYHISSQDILSISVWNHPELNLPTEHDNVNSIRNGYLVNHHGNIYFPLIGQCHVAGKTTDEVRMDMTKRLSYYLKRPHLFVKVADFRSKRVYVMGEVMKPGFLPLTDQSLSIADAINMTGSFDPNSSDPRHIYVIRGDVMRPEVYWLNVSSPTALLLGERFQLHDKDIVIVSTATVTRWNRFLNQLLPTLQTVWYTKSITRD